MTDIKNSVKAEVRDITVEDQERALKLATEAGHILLENGAEMVPLVYR